MANLGAILGGGLFLVAGNAFLFVGQQTVPSGVAAIMQSLVPIVTSLWAFGLLPEERVSATGAVGILLGFLGVGLIVRPDPANLLGSDVIGRVLVFLQVASVALGGVLVQRAKPTLGNAALSGWSMVVGAIVLHATSLALGESFALLTSASAVAAVAYLGVFATAIAFFIYFTLLEVRGALETSLVAYLVPVVATVVGVVVLDEEITALTVVGFLVVFAGFLVLGGGPSPIRRRGTGPRSKALATESAGRYQFSVNCRRRPSHQYRKIKYRSDRLSIRFLSQAACKTERMDPSRDATRFRLIWFLRPVFCSIRFGYSRLTPY